MVINVVYELKLSFIVHVCTDPKAVHQSVFWWVDFSSIVTVGMTTFNVTPARGDILLIYYPMYSVATLLHTAGSGSSHNMNQCRDV